jgi:predicted negative regulator of RcsB-dependent stress response
MKLLTLAALSVGLGFSQSNDCDTLDKCQEALKTNRSSSLIHFRIAEIYFQQGKLPNSANEFHESLNGDYEPRWTAVWAHIGLGKIFDVTKQRDRALNEYRQALRTKDNTRGALEEAAKYIETPYNPPELGQRLPQ